jgi:hypothetical protein
MGKGQTSKGVSLLGGSFLAPFFGCLWHNLTLCPRHPNHCMRGSKTSCLANATSVVAQNSIPLRGTKDRTRRNVPRSVSACPSLSPTLCATHIQRYSTIATCSSQGSSNSQVPHILSPPPEGEKDRSRQTRNDIIWAEQLNEPVEPDT